MIPIQSYWEQQMSVIMVALLKFTWKLKGVTTHFLPDFCLLPNNNALIKAYLSGLNIDDNHWTGVFPLPQTQHTLLDRCITKPPLSPHFECAFIWRWKHSITMNVKATFGGSGACSNARYLPLEQLIRGFRCLTWTHSPWHPPPWQSSPPLFIATYTIIN